MKRNLTLWNLISLLLLGAFGLFILYPLFLILYKSVISGDGGLSLQYFSRFFAKKFYWGTMIHSLQVTVTSTVLSAAIGLPMAYLMRSVKIRGSVLLNVLIVISYLSPPFIGAYAWIQLLGRNGVVTQFFKRTFWGSPVRRLRICRDRSCFYIAVISAGLYLRIRSAQKSGQFSQ